MAHCHAPPPLWPVHDGPQHAHHRPAVKATLVSDPSMEPKTWLQSAGAQTSAKVGHGGPPGAKKEKRLFTKMTPGHAGCHGPWLCPILGPWWSVLAKIAKKAMKMGHLGARTPATGPPYPCARPLQLSPGCRCGACCSGRLFSCASRPRLSGPGAAHGTRSAPRGTGSAARDWRGPRRRSGGGSQSGTASWWRRTGGWCTRRTTATRPRRCTRRTRWGSRSRPR